MKEYCRKQHESCRNIYKDSRELAGFSQETREKSGHWELDTVVSSRGKSKGCLATFVERKSRLYTAIKMPDRSAASMESAITQVYSTLPSARLKQRLQTAGKNLLALKHSKKS